jgi:hypothetical protein
MPLPTHSVASAERLLNRLRSTVVFDTDALFDIRAATAVDLLQLEQEARLLDAAISERPFIDRILDIGSWVIGVTGFLADAAITTRTASYPFGAGLVSGLEWPDSSLWR